MKTLARTCALLVLACALALSARAAHADPGFSAGDTTLAAGASITLYPCFSPGGSHIHSPQFATVANGLAEAASGYVYAATGAVRMKAFSYYASIDTSGFTVPAPGNSGFVPAPDSIKVTNWSGASTVITWKFLR